MRRGLWNFGPLPNFGFLAFSRRQPVDPRLIDINALIGSVEELLRRPLGENVALKAKVPADLWMVRCDGNQLENALLNLTINASDGTVTLSEIDRRRSTPSIF